jgi:uncharacterized protein YbjT (DUF2867 family)
MNKIVVAGSTGYLGSHIVEELLKQSADFKALARNEKKLEQLGLRPNQIIKAQVTEKESLKNCCEGIDIVISSLGITRQKDGLTYMDVDYQANKNLLEEAERRGVKKFIYVSVLNGDQLRHLKICEAKEKFVDDLKASKLDYCIIRPSGFFSDMKEFYNMAKGGSVYLLGDGSYKVNPIHGADLAKVCINAIGSKEKSIDVGGRDILTHTEIAKIAFKAVGKKDKIRYIPDWVRRLLLRLAGIFMGKASYGPTEFFLNVMAMDMTAPKYGQQSLEVFFKQLNRKGD